MDTPTTPITISAPNQPKTGATDRPKLPSHLDCHPVDIISRCELKLAALSTMMGETDILYGKAVNEGMYFLVDAIRGELRYAVDRLNGVALPPLEAE